MLTTKKSLLAASIITVSLSLSSIMTVNAASHEKTEDAVIATVNGDKIMKSTLDGYLEILKKQNKVKLTLILPLMI